MSFRHVTEPLAPDAVLGILASSFCVDAGVFYQRLRGNPLRAIAARCLIRYAGQSQRQAAETLGVGTGAAICIQLKSLAGKLENDQQLCQQLARAEELLSVARSKATDNKNC